MDFYRKYELFDALSGEGTRSFRARQIATSREVTVHLLTGGKTPENEALLTRLRTLPEGSLRKLIEVGDNDGTTFVATEAPPFLHLAEWLAEQERAAGAADALKYTRAGVWKIPVAPASPPPPDPSSAAPPSSSTEGPGEFTRMFQQGGVPAPQPAAPEPGEFTRQFQASQLPPAALEPVSQPGPPDLSVTKTMRIPLPANLPAAPKSTEPAAAPAAGEFTRMFQAAGASPPPAVEASPAEPAPAAAAGGEFTRVFQKPAEASPLPHFEESPAEARSAEPSPPAATPKAAPAPQPGEFTRMFRKAPEAPTTEPPAQAAPPKTPSEFTRVFNAPLPSASAPGDWPAQPPMPAAPGEFTRMFQSPPPRVEQPPVQQQPSGGGEFTRMFNAGRSSSTPTPQFPSPAAFPPAQPEPAAPAPAPKAGEFTQMFGRPGAGVPPQPTSAPPQSPIQPGYGGGGGFQATGAFRTPAAAPPPAGVQQGPSEYTQMMRAPSAAPQVPPGAGEAQAPPMQMSVPQAQMPQVPAHAPQVKMQPPQMQMPKVNMAPMPAPKMPSQVPVKAPGPNILLIAIFCLLAFLVGALLMVLLLKK